MQVSAREAIASYDGQQTAQRLTAATTSALVQVAPTLTQALTLTLTLTRSRTWTTTTRPSTAR